MRTRVILAFVLLAAISLSAQTFRGTILGTVTDPSGAVVAGASVSVKNAGTGLDCPSAFEAHTKNSFVPGCSKIVAPQFKPLLETCADCVAPVLTWK